MTIGDRIKEVRLSLPNKTSMEKFAERLGVTKGAISFIENGRNQPSDQMIRSICREFNINEEWLRDGTAPMKNETSAAEEISEAVRRLLSDKPASFQSALITVLMRFEEEGNQWQVLEEIFQKVTEEMERRKVDNEKKP